jgi:hypothetical protein
VTWLVDPRRRQNKKETMELLDKMRGEKKRKLENGISRNGARLEGVVSLTNGPIY